MDLTQKLEDRAVSYEASGPSAHHTAALLREARVEIERLRATLVEIRANSDCKWSVGVAAGALEFSEL
jgi:hypothetical protein